MIKLSRVILLSTLGLGMFAGSVSPIQSQAATWHNGAPKGVHGSFASKWFKIHGKKGREYFFISNKDASAVEYGGNGLGVENGLKYRYLGHQKYQLKPHYAAGDYGSYTIKVSKNKKQIYLYHNLGHMLYKVSNKMAVYK